MVKTSKKARQGISLIYKIGEEYNLPEELIIDAESLFLELRNKGNTQPIFGYAAASLFWTMSRDKDCSKVVRLDNFMEKSITSWININKENWKTKIRNRYKKIVEIKGMPLQKCYLSPVPWIRKAGKELGLEEHYILTAVELGKKCFLYPEKPARTPRVIAAACLSFAIHSAGKEISQEKIAYSLNISPESLRNVSADKFFKETTKDFPA